MKFLLLEEMWFSVAGKQSQEKCVIFNFLEIYWFHFNQFRCHIFAFQDCFLSVIKRGSLAIGNKQYVFFKVKFKKAKEIMV